MPRPRQSDRTVSAKVSLRLARPSPGPSHGLAWHVPVADSAAGRHIDCVTFKLSRVNRADRAKLTATAQRNAGHSGRGTISRMVSYLSGDHDCRRNRRNRRPAGGAGNLSCTAATARGSQAAAAAGPGCQGGSYGDSLAMLASQRHWRCTGPVTVAVTGLGPRTTQAADLRTAFSASAAGRQ